VLLASHDLAFVASVADQVFVLGREGSAGRILAEGEPGAILRDESLLQRAGLPAPDFVRLQSLLGAAGLLGSGPVHDEDSLLEALARGGASTPLHK